MVQWDGARTDRFENLRCVIIDRVLSAPLLEQEDYDSDEEPRPVAFAQERFLQAEVSSSNTFFVYCSLNLGELMADALVIGGQPAEISQITDGFCVPVFGREPSRRFLDRKKAKRHYTSRYQLQSKWYPPYCSPRLYVETNAH